MHFRCPNCEHQIAVVEDCGLEDPTLSELTCPTCQSKFPIAGDEEKTIAPPENHQIGGFEIRDVLGQGSFGLVYKAWDSELQRYVAIKIPRPGRITSSTAFQFLREARSAAGIRHPNIVSVLEIGQYEDVYYIVTEYIEGITLSEWLKEKSFTADETAALMIKLCDALQSAHDRNMIHRDLKPGNVLMDVHGEPHITDFGLAKRISADEMTVTDDGHVVGTPAYMSPEQARGDSRSLSVRSDVYSLGIMLYEMLTGKKPFAASDSGTVIYRILTEEPIRPRAIRPGIPRDLETICLCAINKDPAKRYESAVAFRQDLANHLQDKPISARPVSVLEKSTKLIRRNKIVTGLCLLLVAAIVTPFLMPEVVPDGHVAVAIETHPPADWIHFTPYHRSVRIPIQNSDGYTVRGAGQLTMPPGLYRVSAGDSQGRFHEVWRFVDDSGNDAIDNFFPHRMWTVDEDGTVTLPGFHIFQDEEVNDELVLVPGGKFDVGYDPDPDGWNGQHRRTIPDLLVGRDEVSCGRFRKVMGQPVDLTSSTTTYLDLLNMRYGARDSVLDSQPVTGYPADVAILYCELAGGRLPFSHEWEYFAVKNGQHPPDLANGPRQITSVSDSTDEPGEVGLRHTADNVAEYTDSVSAKYVNLYPEFFPEELRAQSKQVRSLLESLPPAAIEVRGGPSAWVLRTETTVNPAALPGEQAARYNTSEVRNRIAVPAISKDLDAEKNFARIGWRMVRTADRQSP